MPRKAAVKPETLPRRRDGDSGEGNRRVSKLSTVTTMVNADVSVGSNVSAAMELEDAEICGHAVVEIPRPGGRGCWTLVEPTRTA